MIFVQIGRVRLIMVVADMKIASMLTGPIEKLHKSMGDAKYVGN